MERRLATNESHAPAASSDAARGEISPSSDAPSSNGYDWKRLELAVGSLAHSHERLLQENETLRGQVATKDRRIRELDEQLMGANQKRQEVGKRIQELIAQIDHLDAELGGADA